MSMTESFAGSVAKCVTKENFKEKILEIVNELGSVNFAELRTRYIGEAMAGNDTIEANGKNVVFWVNVCTEFADAFIELSREKKIGIIPTSPFIYMMDGIVLDIPLATNPPKGGYKRTHWLPASISTYGKALETLSRLEKENKAQRSRRADI